MMIMPVGIYYAGVVDDDVISYVVYIMVVYSDCELESGLAKHRIFCVPKSVKRTG